MTGSKLRLEVRHDQASTALANAPQEQATNGTGLHGLLLVAVRSTRTLRNLWELVSPEACSRADSRKILCRSVLSSMPPAGGN